MHVYDPFKSTVTTYASTAIPMERERGEAKTLSFATFAPHTRLCAAACCLSRACLVPCGPVSAELPGVANCSLGILNANNTPVR